MNTGRSKQVRCAIYTRVSTDQGLEQDFNSLDAQYDASQHALAGLQGHTPGPSATRPAIKFSFHPPATHEIADGDAMLAAALAGCGLLQMPDALLQPYILTRTYSSAHGSPIRCRVALRRMADHPQLVAESAVCLRYVGHLG